MIFLSFLLGTRFPLTYSGYVLLSPVDLKHVSHRFPLQVSPRDRFSFPPLVPRVSWVRPSAHLLRWLPTHAFVSFLRTLDSFPHLFPSPKQFNSAPIPR
ncbi:hypothetical protein NPIL_520351 [Nephila pilipes]|uniref:Secreted protein n=1 Tax=Nephila pilipes TaxID=299642 RepID=A0A8X6ND25_NEPPI|nr:hypothetical protein NPIL_520351 [Nephila pilipes]